MKKLLLSVAAAFTLICVPAFSVEWGGLSKTFAKTETNDFSNIDFTFTQELYAWGKIPFGRQSPFYAIGEVLYKGNFFFPTVGMENVLDVDLLKISGELEIGSSSKLSMNLGRFTAADGSRKLFAQLIDGAQVEFDFIGSAISGFAGYTGFLNNHTISMMDYKGNVESPSAIFYSFALPYFIGEAKLDYPLFGDNSGSLEALAIYDVENPEHSRAYAEFSFAGPFQKTVYYKLTSIFGVTDFDKLASEIKFSNYTNLNFFNYITDSFMIDYGVEYASGSMGFLNPYIPVTALTASCGATCAPLSGCIIPSLGITVTTSTFYGALAGKFVFEWPFLEEFIMRGPECDLYLQFNIFSDLKITLDVAAFYDIYDGSDTTYSVNLGTAISF